MVSEVRYTILPDSALVDLTNATMNESTPLIDAIQWSTSTGLDPRLAGVTPIQLVGTLSLAVGIILVRHFMLYCVYLLVISIIQIIAVFGIQFSR